MSSDYWRKREEWLEECEKKEDPVAFTPQQQELVNPMINERLT